MPLDSIIPLPAAVRRRNDTFLLTEETAIVPVQEHLLPLADRFRSSLARFTGLDLSAPTVASSSTDLTRAIRFELGPLPDGDFVNLDPLGRRADDGDPRCEAHVIDISDFGVSVTAPDPEGIFRGLMSVAQLAGICNGSIPLGRIIDAPRFAWRGLSIDVVRTFVSIDTLKDIVDMLSLYKMNVLHVHLTDNEAWRIEVAGRSRLVEQTGEFFTRQEFQSLVEYAGERFVTVVPEIDLPGHVGAIRRAYPELVREGEGNVTGLDLGSLDPRNEEVWTFVEEVLTEIAGLTNGAYVHIGGDEAFGMTGEDHAEFVSRAVTLVRGLGKRVVGWQEVVRGNVGPDEIVQYWIDFAAEMDTVDRSSLPPEAAFYVEMFTPAMQDLAAAEAKGTGVLLSPTAHAYLDRPHGDLSSDPEQNAKRSVLGLQFYPPTSLEDFSSWTPESFVDGVQLSALVGVEGALWCETVTSLTDLQELLLPRLPALAEAGWSRPGRFEWRAYRQRLAPQAHIWRRRNWNWFLAESVDWPSPNPSQSSALAPIAYRPASN